MNSRALLQTLAHQRYVLMSLLAFMLALPALAGRPGSRLFMTAILVLIVVTGPASLSTRRRDFMASICLALLMWAGSWVAVVMESRTLHAAAALASTVFFGHLCFLIYSRHLFSDRTISRETLYAATNAYLALGLMFAFLFSAIEALSPGAFRGAVPQGSVEDIMNIFVYYSFVTLATLGYGDITPVIPLAMTLAYLEAVVGQLYVAMTVARVVGIYGSQSRKPS